MQKYNKLISRLKFKQLLLIHELGINPILHKTAKKLGISQPTATKLLQDIEEDLNVSLFERTSLGLVPTNCGKIIIRYAAQILNDVENLATDIQKSGQGVTGNVRIGAIGASIPDIISKALSVVVETHPQIRISLQIATSDELLAMLEAGTIDLALGRPIVSFGSYELNVKLLNKERLCVVSGTQNPLNLANSLSLRELQNEKWILQPSTSPMRRAIENIFSMSSIQFPKYYVEISSIFATADLIINSNLITVMPESIFHHYEKYDNIKKLPVVIPDILGPYSIMRLEGRSLNPATNVIYNAICDNNIGNPD